MRGKWFTRCSNGSSAGMGYPTCRCTTYGTARRRCRSRPASTSPIISKRLGQSKISLTSDTYRHLIGTVGKTAAEAAAAIVPRQRRAG